MKIKLKRLLSGMLAMTMALGLETTAFAAEITPNNDCEENSTSYYELYSKLEAIAEARGIELMAKEDVFTSDFDVGDDSGISGHTSIKTPTVKRTIKEGESVRATVVAGIDEWFTFDTPSAGAYDIYTSGSTDTYGTLYKKGLFGLTEIESADGGGSGKNFRIECGLANNTTYYLKVSGGTASTQGSYTLYLKGHMDTKVSGQGGSWRWNVGSPDPDGAFFNIDQITYLDKEKAGAYYIMVSRDEIKDMRDKIINMSYSAAVTYLTSQLPTKISKKLTAGAAGWIVSQMTGFTSPNLTQMELDSIATAAGIGSDGVATRGLKIVSCTTYTVDGMPVMMNTYESWPTSTMTGQKYYRGQFSSSTTPMWR